MRTITRVFTECDGAMERVRNRNSKERPVGQSGGHPCTALDSILAKGGQPRRILRESLSA